MDKSLGKNTVFVRNEDEAMREMRFRAECDVQPVCAPPDCKTIYYISERGKMYIFRPYKGYYVLYELAHRLNNGHIPFYELQTTSGKAHGINIERLVYCTFVLGEYKEGLKVEFKDGNPMNFDVSNLRVKNLLNEDAAMRMFGYVSQYEKEFNNIVSYLSWYLNIEKEDAQDVAQDAFLDMLARKQEQRARNFTALWVSNAVELGINLWQKRTRFKSLDYMEREPGRSDVPFGLDVLNVLGNTNYRKCLDLKLQGASMKEIAEETGLSVNSIGCFLKKAKSKVQNYLKTDKELMKIYGK